MKTMTYKNNFFKQLADKLIINLCCFLLSIFFLSNSTLYSQIKETDQEYQNALLLMGQQDYDKAIIKFKAVIRDNPAYDKAYLKIFHSYKRINALDKALAYFLKTSSEYPKNPAPLYGLSLVYKSNGDKEQAYNLIKKAIQLGPQYALIYSDFINIASSLKKFDEANDVIKNISRQNPENGAANYGLGYAYQIQRDWDNGIKKFNIAIESDSMMFDAYIMKGAIFWYIGKFKEFLDLSTKGKNLAEKKNDLEFQCKFWGNMGLATLYLSDYPEAQKYCDLALNLAIKIGNFGEEGRNLGNLGVIYRDTNKQPEALDFFERALNHAKQLKIRGQEGLHYRNIGSVYFSMEEYEKALSYYQNALPIAIETGDKNTEALVLWSIAKAHWQFANYEVSLKYSEQALDIAEKTDNKWGQERYQSTRGLAFWSLGNYSQALDCFEKGYVIASEIGDRYGESQHLGNIAIIYSELGVLEKSLEYYNRALEIAREIGDKGQEGKNLGNIGTAYFELDDFEKALKYFQQALIIEKEIGNRADEAIFIGNVGFIYYVKGDYTSADSCYNIALKISREIKHKSNEGHQYRKLGDLNFTLTKYNLAEKYYNSALEIGKSSKEPAIIWQTYFGLGKVYEKQKKYKKSLANYELALTQIEKIRSVLATDEFKVGFVENKQKVYNNIIRLSAHLHKQYPGDGYNLKSFLYAERAKARALLDIVYQGRIFHNLSGIPEEFQQKYLLNEKNLEKNHLDLSTELAKPESDQNNELIFNLNHKITSLQREKTQLTEEIKEKYPRYHDLANPQLLAATEVQKTILKEKQVLVEYFVGEEQIFVWIINQEKIALRTINISRSELSNKLGRISPLFQKEKDINNIQIDHRWANIKTGLLHELYQILLLNILGDFINNDMELVIVPDKILQYFPFEILVTDYNNENIIYLIEKFPISYSASASLLNPILIKKKTSSDGLLAIGNPDFGGKSRPGIVEWLDSHLSLKSIFRGKEFIALPNSELEVKAIGENFSNPLVFVGKDATEQNFKENAENYRFIHLATHNITDDRQPMYSKIVFAQLEDKAEDNFLQTYEIYNLRLNAELVVLSGCNTGLGKLSAGEGLIGMTRAFLYSGASSLVVSLWPVHDESTAQLMKYFYENLKSGMAKNFALQQAKVKMIRNTDWKSDPFFWGAFVLIGDWNRVEMN